MKAIILAAGRGRRMKALSLDRPKCLLRVNGTPIIEKIIDSLQKGGVNDIAIVTGYKKNLLEKYGDYHFYNKKWKGTNMVFSLLRASEWLDQSPCIVTYSDIYYESEPIKKLFQEKADISITYDINWLTQWTERFGNPLIDAETFKINKRNFLTEIGNKPDDVSDIEGQYMGILKFKPSGWALIKNILNLLDNQTLKKIDLTSLLMKCIEQKIKVKAIPISTNWREFDSMADFQNLNKI